MMENWKEEMQQLISKIELPIFSYVECKVDQVYIYLYSKDGLSSYSFFYMLDGKIYSCHEIISALGYQFKEKQDELGEVFRKVLDIFDEIRNVWEEHNGTRHPAETKIIYDLCSRTEEIFYNDSPLPIEEEQDIYSYLDTWENELKVQCGQEPDKEYLKWQNERMKKRKKNWKEETKRLISKMEEAVSTYVDGQVDKAYIYLYSKDGLRSSSFFYMLDGKIYSCQEVIPLFGYQHKQKQDEVGKVYTLLNSVFKNMKDLWAEHNGTRHPAETKIIYDLCSRTEEIFYNDSPLPIEEEQDIHSYLHTWENELKVQCGQEPDEEYLKWQNERLKKRKKKLKNNTTTKGSQSAQQSEAAWNELVSSHIGKMTAIQFVCGEYVAKGDWNVDFQRGVIAFGTDEYPIQYMGSESNVEHTWLWAWENINQFPERLLVLANDTKQKGAAYGIEPLINAELELNADINGHNLMIVACGLQEPPVCYYRCPHANGAAFVALSDVPDAVFAPVDLQGFLKVATFCLQKQGLVHKTFMERFLDWNKTDYHWEKNCLIAQFEQELRIEFEQAGEHWRIKQMQSVQNNG